MALPTSPGSLNYTGRPTNPKTMVVIFVILTFLFSSVFWYLTAQGTMSTIVVVGVMWCPAAAAVVTRLIFQRNLKGFGLGVGKPVWLAVGILLPIAAGLIMFGSAWLSGIAPFNTDNAAIVFSFSFVPTFLYAVVFSCFAAAGEEFGWRGFLVPELARFQSFTTLALLSGAIWAVWHLPLMFFGNYHGAGPIWYSLVMFIPAVMGAGLILAWLRLASGSVWVAVLFHGFWNYFIQVFYPDLTVTTPEGTMMLGEFGWFVVVLYVALALVFWHFRDRLPKLPAEGV